MNHSFETYFKSLEGSWNLDRKISTGEILSGRAVFEPVSDTVFLLREEGYLTLSNGRVIVASRNWYWHLSKKQTLEITYDEARKQDYHLVELKNDSSIWVGTAEHLCGDDLYAGHYRFFENRFEVTQAIKGPNKDYSVSSHYSK